MSNMSYCRFQNTKNDLSDCVDTLEEMSDGSEETFEELSDEEKRAMKNMVELCQRFLEYESEIEKA